MCNGGAMHNSYSIANLDRRSEALALYLPIGGGAEGGGAALADIYLCWVIHIYAELLNNDEIAISSLTRTYEPMNL